jgi:hypothetical protein
VSAPIQRDTPLARREQGVNLVLPHRGGQRPRMNEYDRRPGAEVGVEEPRAVRCNVIHSSSIDVDAGSINNLRGNRPGTSPPRAVETAAVLPPIRRMYYGPALSGISCHDNASGAAVIFRSRILYQDSQLGDRAVIGPTSPAHLRPGGLPADAHRWPATTGESMAGWCWTRWLRSHLSQGDTRILRLRPRASRGTTCSAARPSFHGLRRTPKSNLQTP